MDDSISAETRQKIITAIALVNDSREGFEVIKRDGKLASALTANADMGIRDLRKAYEILDKIVFPKLN